MNFESANGKTAPRNLVGIRSITKLAMKTPSVERAGAISVKLARMKKEYTATNICKIPNNVFLFDTQEKKITK